MARLESTPRFNLGDRVTVRYYPHWRGRIVEMRGGLGPGGAQVYRVRFPDKPKPRYVELPENLLILLPDKSQGQPQTGADEEE
jgi:hypothetical protein